jgi:hypothetical protein
MAWRDLIPCLTTAPIDIWRELPLVAAGFATAVRRASDCGGRAGSGC